MVAAVAVGFVVVGKVVGPVAVAFAGFKEVVEEVVDVFELGDKLVE